MSVKLPKQWEHWCKEQGLHIHGKRYKKKRSDWLYLKGKGFMWRVNCHGMFQRGDPIPEFDRWALCSIDEQVIPNSLQEFRCAVESLVLTYKWRKL